MIVELIPGYWKNYTWVADEAKLAKLASLAQKSWHSAISSFVCVCVQYLKGHSLSKSFIWQVIMILRRKWNQRRLMSSNSMRASSAHDRMATTYTTVDPVSQGNTATYYSTAENKVSEKQSFKYTHSSR